MEITSPAWKSPLSHSVTQAARAYRDTVRLQDSKVEVAGSVDPNYDTSAKTMSELEKKVEEPKENPLVPEGEESKETKPEGEQIDYQGLYEEEKSRRMKAESTIQRHKKPLKTEEEEFSPADPDTIRNVIREELDERFNNLTSQFRSKEIGDTISRFASDANEATLIRYHYDNSIRQTGDLDLDMENAKALANKHRVNSQLEEMKASLVSKGTKSFGSGAGRKPAVEEDVSLPTLTDQDRKIIDQLRQKYVLSNDSIRRILKGERMDELLTKGIVKKRS